MKNLFKIGLYVRVSTEEQAENPEGSIKNQEERLREFVKLKTLVSPFGEIREVFTDAGISAKDMNRPSLQRLLGKIESKEIDLVLVTELSRFTRSIKDFSTLWEFLEKHDCKFLSIKDNFDTSTAAGEMVMYMMANVAQFERKQTAERISLSFLARAKRGLYNGGTLPLGYEVNNEKQGHLKIVPDEAEIVRDIFATFLKQETLAKTAKDLNGRGVTAPRTTRCGGTPRAGIFRIDMVQAILRNKSYIAVRTYKTKGGTEECPAMWEAIVSEEVFRKAQEMLDKNRYRKRSHLDKRHPYTLSGICYCKTCGDRMSGKSAHGRSRKVPYYEHAWATKQQASLSHRINKCEPHRLQAEKIEPLVWQEVKRFLSFEETTRKMLTVAEQLRPKDERKSEAEKLRRKTQALDLQMEALAERITRLPKGVDERVFMNQMAKLQEAKTAAEAALAEIQNRAPTDDVVAYEDFVTFTTHLRSLVKKADDQPEIQTAIIKKLVHRVEVTSQGFELEFYVGHNRIKREVGTTPAERVKHGTDTTNSLQTTGGQGRPSVGLRARPTRPLAKFQKEYGSKRLTNGRGYRTRTDDIHLVRVALYQLS